MSTKLHEIDKTGWPAGPWMEEPDKLQWTDEKTGLPCLIVRNYIGALCGYVGVPVGHRYFGVDKNDVDVRVHGGLTYSDLCTEDGPVCHVPAPGQPDRVWWLGFDCAHSNDLVPQMICYGMDGIYRDVPYVRAECADLAEQLV